MTNAHIFIKYTGFSGLKWSRDILDLIENPGRIVTLEEIHVGSSVAWVTTEVADLIIWVVTPELLEFLKEYTQEIIRGPLGIAVLFKSTPTVDGGELVTECRLPLTAALLPVACRAKWIIINGIEEGMSDKFKKEFIVAVNSTLSEMQTKKSLEIGGNGNEDEVTTCSSETTVRSLESFKSEKGTGATYMPGESETQFYIPSALSDVMQKTDGKQRNNGVVASLLLSVLDTKSKDKSSNKVNLKEIKIFPSKDIYTVGEMIGIILHHEKTQVKKEYTIKFTLKETYETRKVKPQLNNILECSIPDLVGSVNIEVLIKDKVNSSTILVQSYKDYFATLLRKTLNPFEFIKDCTGAKDRDELDVIMCGEFAKKKPQFVFDLPPRGKFVRSYTMLHFTAEYGLPKLCMMLLDCPRSNEGIGIKNRDNLTPIQLSQRAGYSELSEVLLDRSSGGTPRDSGVIDWDYNHSVSEGSEDVDYGRSPCGTEDGTLQNDGDGVTIEDTDDGIISQSDGNVYVQTETTWHKCVFLERLSSELRKGEISQEKFRELYEKIFPTDIGKNKPNPSGDKPKKPKNRNRRNSEGQTDRFAKLGITVETAGPCYKKDTA